MICCGVPRTLPSGPELSKTRLMLLELGLRLPRPRDRLGFCDGLILSDLDLSLLGPPWGRCSALACPLTMTRLRQVGLIFVRDDAVSRISPTKAPRSNARAYRDNQAYTAISAPLNQ